MTEPVTEVREAYEFTHRTDLPPLPQMFWSSQFEGPAWDRAGDSPVDYDELIRLGYARKVRITTTKEYLDG